MSEVVLRGTSLVKTFTDGRGTRTVLDGVDVDAVAGRIACVRGRSGCGKSTLLGVVSGLVRPDAGRVLLHGAVLDHTRPQDVARARRAHIGLVSQSYGLLDEESVEDNVGLPLSFGRPRTARRERAALISDALGRSALDIDRRTRVGRLSGGEKQRVAIARALVRLPTVLVADEPTAALDEVTGSMIAALLVTLARSGVAVLVATHDEQIVEVSDTVLRFEGAQLHRSAPLPA